MNYNFEWDPAKATSNLQKHGVSFSRAAQVFLDPLMLSLYDEEHGEDEDRWVTMGVDRNDVLIVVIHTYKGMDDENTTARIISARKATKQEAKDYEER